MRKISILLLCIFSVGAHAQNVSLDWVKTFGNSASDFVEKILLDQQGNIYTIGSFSNTTDFDPGPSVFNKTSNGGTDIFIQKLDSSGNFIWAHSFGGSGNDKVSDAVIDNNNEIVLSGIFSNAVDFDFGINTDIKTSNGFNDVYILKLSTTGNYIWAKTFGNTLQDMASALCFNANNDITLVGRFAGTVDFDPNLGVTNKTAASNDAFILQLNTIGNLNWVKTLVGSSNSQAQTNDLTIDQNGNFYLTGFFSDTVDFNAGPNMDTLISSSFNYSDPYLLKLDPVGNFVWVNRTRNSQGNGIDMRSLMTDNFGNLYMCGQFAGTIDFDFTSSIYNQTTVSSCAYLMKLDTNGNFKWVKRMGGTNGAVYLDVVLNMANDPQGNVTLCGSFFGLEDFDPGPNVHFLGDAFALAPAGFYLQLDSAGNFKWAKSIERVQPLLNNETVANDVVQSPQGKIYVAGYFWDDTDFDPNSGTNIINSTANSPDAFLLKLKSCTPKSSNDIINSCTPITWINGNTYSFSNFTAQDTLSSTNGCDSVVTLNLTITTIDTSILRTGNNLTANATGATYQWINCANNFSPIAGATNQSFTPSSNGSYAVSINQNSCTDTSMCWTITALSLNDLENDIRFSVFPNPATDYIKLQTNGKAVVFQIYNSLGQIVKVKNILAQQQEVQLEVKKLSVGIYTYTFSNKLGFLSRGKLVLK